MNASSNLNLPNCITVTRIGLVPVLVFLAWTGRTGAFTIVLIAMLLGDLLDGYLARRLNQQTLLGAQLDSWGDLLTALVYPPAAIWLQPELLRSNFAFIAIALVTYLTPIGFGFLKFHRLTSYHTRLATLMAYFMGFGIVCFLAGWSDVPFRLACVLLVISQVEEIAITTLLPAWRANVRDFREALRVRRELAE